MQTPGFKKGKEKGFKKIRFLTLRIRGDINWSLGQTIVSYI